LGDGLAARALRGPRRLEENVMSKIRDTNTLVPVLALMAAAALCAPRAGAAAPMPPDQASVRDAAHAGQEQGAPGRAAQNRAATGATQDLASRNMTSHEKAQAQRERRGLDAAKAGTGASRVATQHSDRITVEETGM
jgi:hypothetical protein